MHETLPSHETNDGEQSSATLYGQAAEREASPMALSEPLEVFSVAPHVTGDWLSPVPTSTLSTNLPISGSDVGASATHETEEITAVAKTSVRRLILNVRHLE